MTQLTEAQVKQINPLLVSNPARRARWAPLLENLADDVKGFCSTSKTRIEQRRIMIESLMDNQLLCVDAGSDGENTVDRSFAPKLHEGLMEFLDAKAQGKPLREDTTLGWGAAGGTSTVPTTPATDKIFTTQSLGMVRRVFPRLLAGDLFSIQTMTQPTGKVFYMNAVYDEAQGSSIASGERVDLKSAWDVADQMVYASLKQGSSTYGSANEEGAAAREINMDIQSTTITAESKKLAQEWSRELQQDLRAYHQLDADEELQTMTAGELTREIDRLLINFLYTTTLASGAGIVYWNKTPPSSLPTEIRAYNETLFDAIEDAAEKIESVRYKKPTWLLMGTKVAARFRKLNGFRAVSSNEDMDMDIGSGARRIFGAINERFTVYVDPWFQDDTIIVGYKGTGMMDAGLVDAPYIPFYRTAAFENPGTFMNKRGIMSRFGKVSVVPEQFSLISLVSS